MKLGGIEAGGTKFVCGIGNENGEVLERISFPTTSPNETMSHVISFFTNHRVEAIGIGSFGPIELDKRSKIYGSITSTPKTPWKNFNIVKSVADMVPVDIGFDTDVNAAALGETMWGAARGLDSCIYMTVGTGIGVGAVVEGKLLHGMSHPEMGHILVRRHKNDSYEGTCPYHGDCLEGLASGPAIEKRWGKKGADLADVPEVWDMEADYLAQAIVNYILVLSPKKVILGGGVPKQKQLFPLIRQKVTDILNNYVQTPELTDIDNYIVPPLLGDNAGLIGSFALAKNALI
ncbi:MAG: ROK family protein [Tuberibacillus sp.]